MGKQRIHYRRISWLHFCRRKIVYRGQTNGQDLIHFWILVYWLWYLCKKVVHCVGSRVVFHWTSDRCPFEAIAIINLPTNLESEVTHRYTANSFKLHRLPTPRPGQVLGLVGTNGIGKSTALKILAGKLKPNLGRYDVRTVFYKCDLDFDEKYHIGSTWLGRNSKVF